MNTNSYFSKGSSHDVCQDYALAGAVNSNISYLILADGCSSSHDICKQVDLGARILVYCAKKHIVNTFIDKISLDGVDRKDLVNSFSKEILAQALTPAMYMGLAAMSLDATLLICITDSKRSLVLIYGDGGFIVHQSNGNVYYNEITYLSGAPYYLSYGLDAVRQKSYCKEFGNNGIVITNAEFRAEGEVPIIHNTVESNPINDKTYEMTSYEINGAKIIALVSDGIKSFQKTSGANIINLAGHEMVMEFAGFKNTQGNFVERRMQALKRKLDKEGMMHYDDISIASVVM